MKKRMSVILALTMAATTMFSAVPAMAKDGDVVNITIWSPTDREQVETWWTEKIAEWNEANPNIQVQKLINLISRFPLYGQYYPFLLLCPLHFVENME